jgi:hypothetical protein
MTDNAGQKFITISFQRISKEERMQILKRELVKMRKNITMQRHPLYIMKNA